MIPPLSILRGQGLKSEDNNDNIWLVGKAFLEAEVNIFKISLLLESLGFFVKQEKSNLITSKRIQHLDSVKDSEHKTVLLPEELK